MILGDDADDGARYEAKIDITESFEGEDLVGDFVVVDDRGGRVPFDWLGGLIVIEECNKFDGLEGSGGLIGFAICEVEAASARFVTSGRAVATNGVFGVVEVGTRPDNLVEESVAEASPSMRVSCGVGRTGLRIDEEGTLTCGLPDEVGIPFVCFGILDIPRPLGLLSVGASVSGPLLELSKREDTVGDMTSGFLSVGDLTSSMLRCTAGSTALLAGARLFGPRARDLVMCSNCLPDCGDKSLVNVELGWEGCGDGSPTPVSRAVGRLAIKPAREALNESPTLC